jgi:exoribonuclease-2
VVRGKPETFNRPDYNFKRARGHTMATASSPTARAVLIGTRQRGAPLDLIVAEAMILANSTWGGWLAELGVPGIYRSQASLLPGIKVRMGTKPRRTPAWAWRSTPGPPRRCAAMWTWSTSGRSSPAPPWPHRRAGRALQAQGRRAVLVISGFDAAYSAYNGFQRHGALLDAEIPAASRTSPN